MSVRPPRGHTAVTACPLCRGATFMTGRSAAIRMLNEHGCKCRHTAQPRPR